MSDNQLSRYREFIRHNSYELTLGEILNTSFAAEYRKYHSLMRQDGWTVGVELNKKEPGLNRYKFVEPLVVKYDGDQAVFI